MVQFLIHNNLKCFTQTDFRRIFVSYILVTYGCVVALVQLILQFTILGHNLGHVCSTIIVKLSIENIMKKQLPFQTQKY